MSFSVSGSQSTFSFQHFVSSPFTNPFSSLSPLSPLNNLCTCHLFQTTERKKCGKDEKNDRRVRAIHLRFTSLQVGMKMVEIFTGYCHNAPCIGHYICEHIAACDFYFLSEMHAPGGVSTVCRSAKVSAASSSSSTCVIECGAVLGHMKPCSIVHFMIANMCSDVL